MFRPFKPSTDFILGKQLAPHECEELSPEPPKPKKVVYAPVEKIREVIAEIQKEFPWYAPTDGNLLRVFDFLQEHNGDFNLENVRVAITVLGNTNALERVPPPPPPPPLPKPEPEKLEAGQIPLATPSYAIKQVLAKASAAQIKDYLDRARKAAQN